MRRFISLLLSDLNRRRQDRWGGREKRGREGEGKGRSEGRRGDDIIG
jgi:hypothetical protein